MALQETAASSPKAKPGRRRKREKSTPVDPKEAFEGMLISAHRIAVMLSEASVFRDSGLSVAEWAVLKQLGDRQDVPVKEVTAAAGVSRQRFRKVVSELESKGLVVSGRAQSEDKRERKISATPTAAEVLSLVSKQLQDLIPETDKPRRGRTLTSATRSMDRVLWVIRRKRMTKGKANAEKAAAHSNENEGVE